MAKFSLIKVVIPAGLQGSRGRLAGLLSGGRAGVGGFVREQLAINYIPWTLAGYGRGASIALISPGAPASE